MEMASSADGAVAPVNSVLPAEGAFRGWFATSNELALELGARPVKDSIVLVKGSRGTRMENVLAAL